ncbi:MAG TPA: hypothetical protein VFT72_11525 [Opitutaceae bacterium]|nr:hypothetical protein [Opitutaceae bacterium]
MIELCQRKECVRIVWEQLQAFIQELFRLHEMTLVGQQSGQMEKSWGIVPRLFEGQREKRRCGRLVAFVESDRRGEVIPLWLLGREASGKINGLLGFVFVVVRPIQ